eukprot:TRINITY_DN6611_c0_g1_i1.p1 TRINITY_DN6611_c0_g1~~TRINITY_DN6611_c0_g1_i1.p1  ORF type:complete len:226 (-),score=51.82 TRINITY_DN6611_c0_g1_i1:104-781(-)
MHAKPHARSTSKHSRLHADLRQLENEAYCAVISAFRAQGELTWQKENVLHELRLLLRIADERHKLEIKRVRQDASLAEIAQNNTTPFLEEEGEIGGGTGKKQKRTHNWGGTPDPSTTAMHLDAVPLPPSVQPPKVTQIPPILDHTSKVPGTEQPDDGSIDPDSLETDDTGMPQEQAHEEEAEDSQPQGLPQDPVLLDAKEAMLIALKEKLRAELEEMKAEIDPED